FHVKRGSFHAISRFISRDLPSQPALKLNPCTSLERAIFFPYGIQKLVNGSGCGKTWAVRAADKNVVVHVPDRCLLRARIVKDVIGLAVPVKIADPHESPSAGNGRPPSATNKGWPRQVEDSCIACIGME